MVGHMCLVVSLSCGMSCASTRAQMGSQKWAPKSGHTGYLLIMQYALDAAPSLKIYRVSEIVRARDRCNSDCVWMPVLPGRATAVFFTVLTKVRSN
jgi:hypothetical protein